MANFTKDNVTAKLTVNGDVLVEYRLKGSKTLDGAVYYELLFTEPLGERSDVIRKIHKINTVHDLKNRQGLVTADVLHERLEKVIHQVAYDISNGKLKRIKTYLDGVI